MHTRTDCLYIGDSSPPSGVQCQGRDPGEGRRRLLEAQSSGRRMAPSTGVQGSDGIPRRLARPRMHKHEQGHRPRGSRIPPSERSPMRFAGIDIAAEIHVVALVDEHGALLVKPPPFGEDATGYQTLRTLLGGREDLLVAMEATGHYWQNLFAVLAAEGFAVALLNPMRTRRFAGEDLARAKTDAIDAVGIARFAAQKRPALTRLPAAATQELRELVRLRDRLRQEFGDRTRQLHRLVDLGFPEVTRVIPDLKGRLATGLLAAYPTAAAFRGVSVLRLAALRADGTHRVGAALARALLEAARESVGQHHGPAYQLQVRYLCEDLELLRRRIEALEQDVATTLQTHEVGMLLTTNRHRGPDGGPAGGGTRRPRALPECRRLGRLRRRRPGHPRIGQAAPHARPARAHRPRPPARGPLDADPRGRPDEPVAASLLRPAARPRQAPEGRPDRCLAQALARDLQRGQTSSPLRPTPDGPGGAGMKKRLDRDHGIFASLAIPHAPVARPWA